jgi:hypothetical protein
MIRCSNGIVIDRKAMTISTAKGVAIFSVFPPNQNMRGPVLHPSMRIFFKCVCHLILQPNQTKMQLFDRLYSHREDGGPYTKIMDVFIHNTGKRLAPIGLRVGHDCGCPRRYWIENENP